MICKLKRVQQLFGLFTCSQRFFCASVVQANRKRVDWSKANETRVVITGLGLTCPLGANVENSWNALISGQSGIRSLKDRSEFNRLPSQVGAWLPESELDLSQHFSQIERRQLSLSSLHALLASDQVLADAQIDVKNDEIRQKRTGTLIGAGMCDLQLIADTGANYEKSGYRAIGPQLVSRALVNSPAGLVSIRHKLRGPNSATSTACTTGLHAIGDAYQLIRVGRADRMVAGGVDYALNPLVLAAFCRLRALSSNFNDTPELASRPFDEKRDGFVLGEGCGLLFLESLDSAKQRNAKIYAEILGKLIE